MRDISFYIDEVFVGESKKLVELKLNDAIKVLTDAGYANHKDFTADSKEIYVRSEDIAQKITDDLTGEYEVTYDDTNPKKVVLSILK